MISAKIATLFLLKIKIFSNKHYDLIIFSMTSLTEFYGVAQIIL